LEDEMRDHREVSGNTPDSLEGRKAFFDKRTPKYDGL
jgi:1,4-dihydroxy-2-naphthoyl-CoA synthase